MTGSVTVTVGGATYTFNMDERDAINTINQMIVLGNPPMGTYELKDLRDINYKLETQKDKDGNVYVNMVAKGRTTGGQYKTYKAKLGTYKDKSGFFWNNYKEYVREAASAAPKKAVKQEESDDSDYADDIPF